MHIAIERSNHHSIDFLSAYLYISITLQSYQLISSIILGDDNCILHHLVKCRLAGAVVMITLILLKGSRETLSLEVMAT
jgi:hypothetical protein